MKMTKKIGKNIKRTNSKKNEHAQCSTIPSTTKTPKTIQNVKTFKDCKKLRKKLQHQNIVQRRLHIWRWLDIMQR